MGYNITPDDGGSHVGFDGPGCGCLIAIFLIGGGLVVAAFAEYGGGSSIGNRVLGILCMVIGVVVYKKMGRN